MEASLSSPAPLGKSLTSTVFERLRADILLGKLRPSERLRIMSLSERYGVGATAIREALSRLVSDELVESEDQRGFCVAAVSREDLLDLTRTRIDVEGIALAGALERGGVEWESSLLAAFHRLSRTPAPISPDKHEGWAVAHRGFHEALLAGCGSPWTLRLCRLLHDKSERYRNLAELRTEPNSRDAVTEHRQLMEAAMARDQARARQLLAEHFRTTTDIILASNGVQDVNAAGKKRPVPPPEERNVTAPSSPS